MGDVTVAGASEGPAATAGPAEGPARSAMGGGGVVHLVSSPVGRGAQVYARLLVDALGGIAAGHELWSVFGGQQDVAVDATVARATGETAVEGIRPSAVIGLRRALRRRRPRVVVAHGGDAAKYAALAGADPLVLYAVGPLSEPARHGLRRWLWRWIASRPVRVAAVTSSVADECRTVLGVRPDRLTLIPNGRDPRRFSPPPGGDGAAGHGGDGRDPRHPVVLCTVGRLEPRKDPARFVDVVAALRARGLAVTGRLVGDGPLATSLARVAAGAGVTMPGQLADVVPELQAADLFLFLPTPPGEGMPGALVEAALCGLPAVVLDVPGLDAVLVPGRTGLAVAAEDHDGLVEAVAGLVADPARRRSLGRVARQLAEGSYALDATVAAWRQLLEEVAPARAR